MCRWRPALTATRPDVLHATCPLCKSVDISHYVRIGTAKHDRRFDVLQCIEHRVSFANDVPPPLNQRAAGLSLKALYETPRDEARQAQFLQSVSNMSGLRTGRFHDVGCGLGGLLSLAARCGWEVSGNDISLQAVEQVRIAGIECHFGTFSSLPIPRDGFDLITSYCVLPHHLPAPDTEIAAVFRALKPGGWFLLELPDDGLYRKLAIALYRVSFRRWESVLGQIWQAGGHQYAFDRTSIADYLRQCGFTEITVRAYDHESYWSSRRFSRRSWIQYKLAIVSLAMMHFLSQVTGMTNHMIVAARKPLV